MRLSAVILSWLCPVSAQGDFKLAGLASKQRSLLAGLLACALAAGAARATAQTGHSAEVRAIPDHVPA